MSAGPRHSRKEIRDFAAWLRKEGWTYESTDSKGHTLWSHPSCLSLYRLSETPKHFNVQHARRDVLKLMGRKVEGKRRPKPSGPGHAAPARRADPLPLAARQEPRLSIRVAQAIERAERNRRFYEGLMRHSR
jgi:hypothetical protein